MKMYTAQDMRDAEKCLFACDVDLKHDNRDISRMLRQSADMMEKTTPTREKSSAVGNAAAMREALGDVYNTLEQLHPYAPNMEDISRRRAFRSMLCHAKNVIDITLSAPPRNCDVGTAEEQFERFDRWCNSRVIENCCGVCCRKCLIAWSQMPYEGGGEK